MGCAGVHTATRGTHAPRPHAGRRLAWPRLVRVRPAARRIPRRPPSLTAPRVHGAHRRTVRPAGQSASAVSDRMSGARRVSAGQQTRVSRREAAQSPQARAFGTSVPPVSQPSARLARLREEHPGVTIGAGYGWWPARIPEANVETVITTYTPRSCGGDLGGCHGADGVMADGGEGFLVGGDRRAVPAAQGAGRGGLAAQGGPRRWRARAGWRSARPRIPACRRRGHQFLGQRLQVSGPHGDHPRGKQPRIRGTRCSCQLTGGGAGAHRAFCQHRKSRSRSRRGRAYRSSRLRPSSGTCGTR